MSFAFLRKRLRNLSWWRPRRDRRHVFGSRGERKAARYLRRHRYRILARNYRCAAGEIDLVCLDKDVVVFIEVKTRTSEEAEELHEALRPSQWRRIDLAARYFLMEHAAQGRPYRFDLVTVLWPKGARPTVQHFEDAYQPRHG